MLAPGTAPPGSPVFFSSFRGILKSKDPRRRRFGHLDWGHRQGSGCDEPAHPGRPGHTPTEAVPGLPSRHVDGARVDGRIRLPRLRSPVPLRGRVIDSQKRRSAPDRGLAVEWADLVRSVYSQTHWQGPLDGGGAVDLSGSHRRAPGGSLSVSRALRRFLGAADLRGAPWLCVARRALVLPRLALRLGTGTAHPRPLFPGMDCSCPQSR